MRKKAREKRKSAGRGEKAAAWRCSGIVPAGLGWAGLVSLGWAGLGLCRWAGLAATFPLALDRPETSSFAIMPETIQVSLSLKTARLAATAAKQTGKSVDGLIAEAIESHAVKFGVIPTEKESADCSDWLDFAACSRLAQTRGRFWKSPASLYKFVSEAESKGFAIARVGRLVCRPDFEAALLAIPSKHNRSGFQAPR